MRVAASLQTHSRRFWYRYRRGSGLAEAANRHITVIEAVMRHCLSPGAALGPFLSVANKLFLTQRELCDGYREAVLQCAREGRAGAWGASMLAYRVRMQAMRVPVRFLGQDLLVCP